MSSVSWIRAGTEVQDPCGASLPQFFAAVITFRMMSLARLRRAEPEPARREESIALRYSFMRAWFSSGMFLMALSVVMIKRTLLIYLVDQAISQGLHDLEGDVLRPAVRAGSMKIMGYEEKSYYRRVETIRGYFNLNMDLLKQEVFDEVFGKLPIYTKTRDSVPTIYRENARISNSLIADGCVIDGDVEGSIISRGVVIGTGAKLKNCVILQDCYIEDGVELENVIFDKAVTIRKGERLVGPNQYPIVIGKNVTL